MSVIVGNIEQVSNAYMLLPYMLLPLSCFYQLTWTLNAALRITALQTRS